VNLVDLVLDADLVESLNDALLEADGITHVEVAARLVTRRIAHCLVEAHDLYIKKGQVRQLVNLPLIVLDGVQDMERDELADQLVCLLGLDVDDALVVDLLPLNHLAVMDTRGQQH